MRRLSLFVLLCSSVGCSRALPPVAGRLPCREAMTDLAADAEILVRSNGGLFTHWGGSAGARPVSAPTAVWVETDMATNGLAVLTLAENKGHRPSNFFVSTSRWERVTRFEPNVPAGLAVKFFSVKFVAEKPFDERRLHVLSVTGEVPETAAGACKVDVETGHDVRTVYDGDPAPTVTLANAAPQALAWTGEIRLADAFGREVKMPVDVTVPSQGRARIPVPWPLPARGWWGVTASIAGADGSSATSTASFAWLDRHDVTPPLAPGKFRIGLQWHNGRLTDRLVGRTLDAVVRCGAKLVRTGLGSRRYVHKGPGQYDWAKTDELVAALSARGLAVNATVWSTPPWAESPVDRVCRHPEHPLVSRAYARICGIPTDLALCEEYYAALAARYGERIAYYEIGNEWDLYNFYPGTTEDAVTILKTCFRGLKRGNPRCVVAPCGWALPDAGGRDHRLAERFVNYGIQDRLLTEAKGFYDVHAVHLHGGFASFRERVIGKFLPNRRRIGVSVPWYANETASSCVFGNEISVAEDVWKKVLFAWAYGARDFSWYNLHATGWDPKDSEQGYGIVTPDFRPRPAYAAFSALTAVFSGLDFARIVRSERDGLELYAFSDARDASRGLVLAGWRNRRHDRGTVRVRTDAPCAVAVDMMGNRTALPVASGVVSWDICDKPGALVLTGATEATPVAEDLDTSAGDEACLTVGTGDVRSRPPDYVAASAEQVCCPYDANPATADRTWKGPDDCSLKAWLTDTPDGFAIHAEVTDDILAPGDCLKVELAYGERTVTRAAPSSEARRRGRVTVYDVSFPGPRPTAVAVRAEDDDGAGFDLWIGTERLLRIR